MPNAQPPPPDELPSPRTLIKATLVAIGVAAILIVVAILPGEYGIDPTGIGRAIGLTQMGELKAAAVRAEADDATGMTRAADVLATAGDAVRADTIRVALQPGQGREVKLVMRGDATAEYRWTTDRGTVGYEIHGEEVGGASAYVSYEAASGAWSGQGALVAAFDGRHGWYWENQSDAPLTVTLIASGAYLDVQGGE